MYACMLKYRCQLYQGNGRKLKEVILVDLESNSYKVSRLKILVVTATNRINEMAAILCYITSSKSFLITFLVSSGQYSIPCERFCKHSSSLSTYYVVIRFVFIISN